MSAKEKIQSLTNTWYGVAVIMTIISVVANGIGIFSLGIAGVSLTISLFFTWLIGFLLLRKSSFTRVVVVVLSALGVVGGILGVPWAVYQGTFGTAPFLAGIGTALMMACGVFVYARTFRVLTDRTVKAYFA